jgi:Xaa-Pro aminopeptidase
MPTGASREKRLACVRAALDELGADALLVTHLPNITYLAGLRATAAALIVARGRARLVTDFRYKQQAAETLVKGGGAPSGLELAVVETNYDEAIAAALADIGARRVAVEAAHLTVKQFDWLSKTLGPAVVLVPSDRVVERLRAVKDAEEIALLREGARRLSGVAAVVWSFVVAGRTERQVAAAIDAALVEAGFERPAFETIVASGPNAAMPHARPTPRRLAPGDPLVLDFGGVYDGYSVDLTRAGVIGRPGKALADLHEAVASAQAAAVAAVRPGVPACDVDAAARETLAARGYGPEAFGHGTGHGLGLEVHEEPRIAPRRSGGTTDAPLEIGMVFTIEPGAYVPGVGGVRLEDDVLVTADGCEVLTEAPRALYEIPAG